MRLMLLNLSKSDGPPVHKAFLFVVGFAAVGICVLAVAMASGSFMAAETESGTLGGSAVQVADAGASGGHAIQFGTGATPLPQQTCNSPIFSSSDVQGQWHAPSGDYVNNNVWNTAEAGPQTLSVCGLGSWYVTANQPDLANDQGSVKSYPSVCGCGFGDTKQLGQFTNITTTYGEAIPAKGEWDSGYDMWTNNWSNEILVENDTNNHPPQDGTPVTIDGIAYHALQVSPDFVVLGMDTHQKSGTLNVLHIFQKLEAMGWAKATDTLTAIGWGVEISYTESSPGVKGQERFDITNWSLTAN